MSPPPVPGRIQAYLGTLLFLAGAMGPWSSGRATTFFFSSSPATGWGLLGKGAWLVPVGALSLFLLLSQRPLPARVAWGMAAVFAAAVAPLAYFTLAREPGGALTFLSSYEPEHASVGPVLAAFGALLAAFAYARLAWDARRRAE